MLVGLLNLLPLVLAIGLIPTSRETTHPAPAMATWPMTQGTMLLAQDVRYGFALAALVPLLVGLPLSGALILGGWKMMRLELFWLALIVSVVATLPCHVGFILGLPVGLWSLAVLSRSDVKTAFRQYAAGELGDPSKGF
jgi:hypothetical protein